MIYTQYVISEPIMTKKIICEICMNEIEESSVCPICGAGLSVDLNEYSDWDVAYTTNNIIDAAMYKSMLEGAEIPVSILSQIDSTRMFTIGDLAIVKIMVPRQYIIEAKQVIVDINNSEDVS
jgi:hypothetical protein